MSAGLSAVTDRRYNEPGSLLILILVHNHNLSDCD
jgi:hypothetical protein